MIDLTEVKNYTENRKILIESTIKKPFFSILSLTAFLLGILSIITPGFGFYTGIIAITVSLADISRGLFIFDRVKAIWLDLSAIVMGIYGIMEMFF